jgi:arsenate reductase
MIKILFICVENSCRSQMAEGFARHFGKDVVEAYSAGSRPSGVVNARAVEVMQEAGIDISAAESKGFNQLPVKKFNFVITLGCYDICSFVPAGKHIEWQIEDPKGKDIEIFRKIRDEVRDKVKKMIEEISVLENSSLLKEVNNGETF